MEVLKGLNPKKAEGPDGIQPFMLKQGGLSIAKSLNRIFGGPNTKKKAQILKAQEFRQISLISVCAKLFEKHVARWLSNVCEESNWLPTSNMDLGGAGPLLITQ